MTKRDPIILQLTQIVNDPKESQARRVQAMMDQMAHLKTQLLRVRSTDPRATGEEQST